MAVKGGVAAEGGGAGLVVDAAGEPGAVARWTGGVVRGSAGAGPGAAAGRRGADDEVSAGGRGAPSADERRAGCAGGVFGAGAGAEGRTAAAGPEEVGAPRPGRRAVALRCTGWAGATGGVLAPGRALPALPVSARPVPVRPPSGGESGTAGFGPEGVAARVTGTSADRWTAGAAGVSRCGARAGAVEGGPGASAARFVAGRAGVAASEVRWDDAGCAGPEDGDACACACACACVGWAGGVARRWTGGCAPVWEPGPPEVAGVLGGVEGRFADREGGAMPPGAAGGVTRATAR
ncbi:hypothetical protein ABS735_23745 [Streptomyces sp. MMCC 100]|uniref:hypothetical protein n=1 Tax=Streptomyces sp. MMCC 100 TaxID=3163555 RepID=UPI003598FBB1